MAITDLNYSAAAEKGDKEGGGSRRASLVGAAAAPAAAEPQSAPPHCTVTQLQFGFAVDLAPQNQVLRRMADIVAR